MKMNAKLTKKILKEIAVKYPLIKHKGVPTHQQLLDNIEYGKKIQEEIEDRVIKPLNKILPKNVRFRKSNTWDNHGKYSKEGLTVLEGWEARSRDMGNPSLDTTTSSTPEAAEFEFLKGFYLSGKSADFFIQRFA